MNKQILEEVSRIHQLMGVKEVILEQNRFIKLADDVVDIIRTVRGVDDISKLTKVEQDFFKGMDDLLRGKKDDEILDFLKQNKNKPGVSKYVDEIETTLFNKLNEDYPELQQLKDTMQGAKNSQTGSAEDFTDEDIVNIINSRMDEISGSPEYKELYVNRLKKELGIKDNVKPTRKLSDDELLITRGTDETTPQRVSQEIAGLETDVTRLEDEALRLSGEQLEAKMDEFIDSWAKKLKEAELKLPPKRRFFKTNQDYLNFVSELKKGMKNSFKAYGESIDNIPQKWFDDFAQLPSEKQKAIFESALQGSTTWKPKGNAGKAWDNTVAVYNWATLKPILQKLPGGAGSGLRPWLKRLGYRYLITGFGQMWYTYISSQYKKFTDEDLTNMSATNAIADYISKDAESGSPQALGGQMVGFLTAPLFTPWNIFAGTMATYDYVTETPSQVGNGIAASKIKDLEDQGLLSSDAEAMEQILTFISEVTGQSTVEGSETYDPRLTKNVSDWKANYVALQNLLSGGGNWKDVLMGLPVSGGLNQLVVDKNKDLLYMANNGAFKIKGEGVNSYIDAIDKDGQEVQIKIKDIFTDKYNRFLGDYRPSDEQPKAADYVEFWPKEIAWDNKGGDLYNDKLQNTIGVFNPNFVGLLTPISNYLRNNGVNLPSKNLQTYAFYEEDEITKDQNGNYITDGVTEVDSFPYLVEKDKVYRIYKADDDYSMKDSEGNSIEEGVYYVTDGRQWIPLLSKAREITSQSQESTNESKTPLELFKEENPNVELTQTGAIGDLVTYKGSNNKRYKLSEGKIVEF